MRVLVTGVTGFAGRHLVSLCATYGCSISGVARRAAAEARPPQELDSYRSIDLSNPADAKRVVADTAPERVFHLAAEASVTESWSNPSGVIAGNIASTLNLLEALRQLAPDCLVLVAGSGEEYGIPQQMPITEEHPLRPQNPYAVSKAANSLAAGFYADAHDLRVVRTRAFNHAGPGQSDMYVVSALARQIAEAEITSRDGVEVLTGNLAPRRDFTDVRDVVRAYWLALERAVPDIYNVCSGRSVPVSGILAALADQTPLEVSPRTDPERVRKHEVMDIYGSAEKLRDATGWQPEIPLEQTVQDTLDWWRARLGAGVPR
jgi:GDP-4-dehydro-6-deoxy-D-mannose reductase